MLKGRKYCAPRMALPLALITASLGAAAQDNSPYSRFGLGDLTPQSNIATRGMGNISAAYDDISSVNYTNPATYSQFLAVREQRSKRLAAGRVILDVGVNFQNRTIAQPNTTNRFTSSDIYFNYLQVGIPLRRNWGLSFGLRPVTRISYLINERELLKDPISGGVIDSSITQYRGNGGSYLPTIGTGFAFGNGRSQIAFGFNLGYLFGNRENERLRSIIDTSAFYFSSSHNTTTSFGDLYYNAGILFKDTLTKTKDDLTIFSIGVSGNVKQSIKARQDVTVQTFSRGTAGEELQVDSIYQQTDLPGTITWPSSYKAGFTFQHFHTNAHGWMIGADYTTTKWNDYRFFGQPDSVRNNWIVSVGASIFPKKLDGSLFQKSTYRFGAWTGNDYIQVGQKMPLYGFTFGMGLPVRNYTRISANQYTVINLALEYGRRGNNDNRLKENLFRLAVGFSLTDLWFTKRKYD